MHSPYALRANIARISKTSLPGNFKDPGQKCPDYPHQSHIGWIILLQAPYYIILLRPKARPVSPVSLYYDNYILFVLLYVCVWDIMSETWGKIFL
jgi:hypothetical protein